MSYLCSKSYVDIVYTYIYYIDEYIYLGKLVFGNKQGKKVASKTHKNLLIPEDFPMFPNPKLIGMCTARLYTFLFGSALSSNTSKSRFMKKRWSVTFKVAVEAMRAPRSMVTLRRYVSALPT